MSRRKRPRLYLRPARANKCAAAWVILDTTNGRYERSTGCGESDVEGAERALAAYIAEKHQAPKTAGQLDQVAIADAVNLYLKEHAPKTRSLDFIRHTAAPIIEMVGR